MELNLRLRDLRNKIKLKQAEVAEHLGISVSTYTKYETGKNQPDLNMLIKLTNFYNVSADYLLGLKSNQYAEKISHDKLELLEMYDHLSSEDKFKLLEIAKTFSNIQSDSTQDNLKMNPKKGA